MTIFQTLATLFGLWMMYEISIHAKKKVLGGLELGFWMSLWLLFIVLALFPQLLIGITTTLRFSRVFDLLIVGSFIVLTVMIFISYFKQKEISYRLGHLVQQLAIKEAVKTTPQKSKRKRK